MSLIDDLVAARAGAAAKLAAALTGDYSDAEEFRPDNNGPMAINRVAYIRELRETVKDLTQQIDDAQTRADGAFEVTSEMSA